MAANFFQPYKLVTTHKKETERKPFYFTSRFEKYKRDTRLD